MNLKNYFTGLYNYNQMLSNIAEHREPKPIIHRGKTVTFIHFPELFPIDIDYSISGIPEERMGEPEPPKIRFI